MAIKALITGVTGMVGSHLCDFLLENTDWEIYGVCRWRSPLDNVSHLLERVNQKDRIFFEYADLNDEMSLIKVAREIKPDYVFHLAAQSYPQTSFTAPIDTLNTNVLGTCRLLEAIHLVMLDDEKYLELAVPYVKEVVKKDYDLNKIALLVKSRIETLCDIGEKIDFFDELPEYDTEMYVHKKMKTTKESSLQVLQDLLPELEALEDYSIAGVEAVLMGYIAKTGIKNGQGLWPVRTAVSGKQSTPGGAYEIMEILGKEESLNRIRKAIAMLEE